MIRLQSPPGRNRLGDYYDPPEPPAEVFDNDDNQDGAEGGWIGLLFGLVIGAVVTYGFLQLCVILRTAWEILTGQH